MDRRITAELISKLEKSTGLLYESTPTDTNVCFATHNLELRDDFKLVFTTVDVLCFLASDPDDDTPTSEVFWQNVSKGRNQL